MSHMLALIWGTSIWISRVAGPVSIPTSVVDWPLPPHLCQHLCFLMTAVLTWMRWNLRAFICILLMTEEDDISSYVFWTFLFQFISTFYSFHSSFADWIVCVSGGGFFLLVLFCFLFCCCCSLDILDIDRLSDINSKSFLPFCWLSLQLIISFAVQKLLNLMPFHYQLLVFFWEAVF